MVEIETGVELPKISRHGRPSKYPFSEMQVGQSFVVNEESLSGVRASASNYGKKTSSKFAVRKCADGLYRCWRTE